MPDSAQSKEEENLDSIESRRKFLKVSAAAGATVAALAAGVHFMPSLAKAGKDLQSKLNFENTTLSADALILVIRDGQLDVYQGENKYTSNDASFARSLSSSVRARM